MKSTITLILALIAFSNFVFTQNVPEGYLLQYQQNFTSGKALDDIKVENPSKWGVFKAGSNFYLQCAAADSVADLPANVAVINNKIFGDFILEADVMAVKDSLGTGELCFFLGLRDLSRYYYVQLANRSDSTLHGIFLVNKSIRTRLTGNTYKVAAWKPNKWHKIRLERNILSRTIIVYLDNMTIPMMQIKDYELIMGSVGVGSLAGTSRFDNIKIWAPTVISE